jgi:hypothetical protein
MWGTSARACRSRRLVPLAGLLAPSTSCRFPRCRRGRVVLEPSAAPSPMFLREGGDPVPQETLAGGHHELRGRHIQQVSTVDLDGPIRGSLIGLFGVSLVPRQWQPPPVAPLCVCLRAGHPAESRPRMPPAEADGTKQRASASLRRCNPGGADAGLADCGICDHPRTVPTRRRARAQSSPCPCWPSEPR